MVDVDELQSKELGKTSALIFLWTIASVNLDIYFFYTLISYFNGMENPSHIRSRRFGICEKFQSLGANVCNFQVKKGFGFLNVKSSVKGYIKH